MSFSASSMSPLNLKNLHSSVLLRGADCTTNKVSMNAVNYFEINSSFGKANIQVFSCLQSLYRRHEPDHVGCSELKTTHSGYLGILWMFYAPSAALAPIFNCGQHFDPVATPSSEPNYAPYPVSPCLVLNTFEHFAKVGQLRNQIGCLVW